MTSRDRLHEPAIAPSTPSDLYADCRATSAALRLPTDRIARAALRPAPSLHYADQREARKRDIDISAAAARLARAIHQD